MTSVSNIIKSAFRESNMLALGVDPTTPAQAEAFSLLKSLVASVYDGDVGERLQDWLVGNTGVHFPYAAGWTELRWKYPIQNSRIILDHATPQILYLPPDPDNGARMQIIDVGGVLPTYPVTLDANGRLIDGERVLLLNVAYQNATWFYDAQNANWVPMDDVTLGGDMPFPEKFDDYFMIKLAARLNPRYGRSLSELSIARLSEQADDLAAEYRQRRNMPAPLAVRRLSDPNQRFFNTGRRGRWGWQ